VTLSLAWRLSKAGVGPTGVFSLPFNEKPNGVSAKLAGFAAMQLASANGVMASWLAASAWHFWRRNTALQWRQCQPAASAALRRRRLASPRRLAAISGSSAIS